MECLTNFLASYLPSTSKPLFSPSVPRSQGYSQLLDHRAYLHASIEPKLQCDERECFKLGPPVEGTDSLGTNKLIQKIL